LKALVDPETRGDPESALLYTLLRRLRYSLQANAKTKEGSSHVDRDAQFRYIND